MPPIPSASELYENFVALKKFLPDVDGIDIDQEEVIGSGGASLRASGTMSVEDVALEYGRMSSLAVRRATRGLALVVVRRLVQAGAVFHWLCERDRDMTVRAFDRSRE